MDNGGSTASEPEDDDNNGDKIEEVDDDNIDYVDVVISMPVWKGR